ncbi:MAG: nucleoid-associated protein [Chlorobi bacterium]|nr:nucleoid-associated protein [Chlorobiota bacterium]
MIITTEANLSNIVLHKIGNKSNDENIHFSKNVLNLDFSIKNLLLSYFLSPFKVNEYYNLYHETDINLNEVYNYVSKIFENPNSLFEQSVNLARHLYEQSVHPKIKTGEFYVAYLKDCIVDGETVDAIGLFKSETKETFLKIYPTEDNFTIGSEDGININKLDKGCLIFNSEKEKGYLTAIVDNVNKNTEAAYWKDNFLKVITREDNYFYTENVMSMCKNFVLQKLPEEYEIERPDQVDLLNKSVKYLKEKEVFDMEEYANNVMQQPDIIDAFKNYTQEYTNNYDVNIENSFEISGLALKKKIKFMRSVIKLDKNFHIYIHGSREHIERGYDEAAGMNFYKVFFNEES